MHSVAKESNENQWHGATLSVIILGNWQYYRSKILKYLRQIAVITPYTAFTFDYKARDKKNSVHIDFLRRSDKMPPPPEVSSIPATSHSVHSMSSSDACHLFLLCRLHTGVESLGHEAGHEAPPGISGPGAGQAPGDHHAGADAAGLPLPGVLQHLQGVCRCLHHPSVAAQCPVDPGASADVERSGACRQSRRPRWRLPAGRLISESRSGADPTMKPAELSDKQIIRLHQLLHEAKFDDPDGRHLSPAGAAFWPRSLHQACLW